MKYILILLAFLSLSAYSQKIVVHDIDGTKKYFNLDSLDTDSIHIGGKVNYVTADSVNGIVMHGVSTQYTDLVFQASTLKTVGQNDKPDFIPANVTLSFPEDTTEMVGIIVQMPHGWKQGTTIYPHVHWRQAANNAVDWKISYMWWNIGDVVPVSYTQVTLATLTQSYTSGTLHQLSTNNSGISGVGKGLSSILIIKLYRKSDSYTGEAELLQFDIHYELERLGSNNETSN